MSIQDVNNVVDQIVTVLLVISIIGAALTLLTFSLFSDIRTYPIKLIMYLCICIVCGFTSFLLASQSWIYGNEPACIFFAIGLHLFFIANFCWTFCIAFNFYQMIVRRNRESQQLERWYHLACWGFPISLAIAVGASLNYGRVPGAETCYIPDDLARFLAFFLPGLIIISSNGILFFFIGREIHETLAGAPKSDQRDRKKEFRVYISIYVSIGLSWVFGYLQYLVPQEDVVVVFYVLFSITTPLQGALIFIFYCLNTKVAARWAGFFGHVIPWCKDLEAKITSSTTQGGSSNNSGASSRGGLSSTSSHSSV
jgi:hypothetical protein